jgi:hypothetical protein
MFSGQREGLSCENQITVPVVGVEVKKSQLSSYACTAGAGHEKLSNEKANVCISIYAARD